MKTWYKIRPVDTFFFKGSTPMVMGENHTSQFIFPPHKATLAGAVRTAVLKQQKIDFKDYMSDSFDNAQIISAIGKAGDHPVFEIIGPFFSNNDQVFIPAPYSWYMEKSDVSKTKPHDFPKREPYDFPKREPVLIYKAKPVQSSYIKTLGKNSLYIAKGRDGELASLGGNWIDIDDFYSGKKSIRVRPLQDFSTSEPRTGIALERDRRVRKSHLYTFNHVRLNPNVELIFGLDHESQMLFAAKGVLQLGGEQRLGHYKTIDLNFHETDDKDGLFMTLSAVPCKEFDTNELAATGKIQYIGGWDMKKRFHKPSCALYPAGSVFTKKTNANQILIKGE